MKPSFGYYEDENGMPPASKLMGLTVIVKNNNVDQAMRNLKKKMLEENVIKDFQKSEAYVPKTVKRRKEKAEAKRRWQKKLRMMSDSLDAKVQKARKVEKRT